MGQVVQQAPAVRGKPPLMANSASSTVDIQQYLTFLLSGEMYAVGILNVKEIIEYGQPHRDPDDAGLHPRRDQPARLAWCR
jgi:hypothetical protein